MDGSVNCLACGQANEASQRFCGNCGSSFFRECPKCGTENPSGYRFCGSCGMDLEEAAPAPRSAEERRWTTVVFADLSGFTELSERLDPEEVRELVERCMESLGAIVMRFGGHVLQITGDELMAIFGAPIAHDDDPARAVRCALEMSLYIREHPEEVEGLSMRIGVNTGETLFAPVGPGSARRDAVTGDAVNTAKRLQTSAPRGSVYVGEETYVSSARDIQYRSVGGIEAKGKEQPVQTWEALAALDLPAARPLGSAPIVGRDGELESLQTMWTRVVKENRPHLVTVFGEPGVGKSRLTAEFERRSLGDARVLHGRCVAYGEAIGYAALASVIKEAAGIEGQDAPDEARRKLGDLVASVAAAESADELASHLALVGALDTEEDRDRGPVDQPTLHASVRRFFEAMAKNHPLCVVIDDIHWADEALLDLLTLIAMRGRDAPLLIYTQARPDLLEMRPSWGGGLPAYASISLEPLDATTSRELVATLGRDHGLDTETIAHIGQVAGGNPLFAEELAATLAERKVSREVPSSLKGLIQARLDALPADERSLLQFAAIFGTVFWTGGVRALGLADQALDLLDSLEHRNLVRLGDASQLAGEAQYNFKHALIKDVAYESLPRARRRELHSLAVAWMEQAVQERADEYVDQLAYHSVQAGELDRALTHLVAASERAHRAALYGKEVEFLAQAIEIAADGGRDAQFVAGLRGRRGRALVQLARFVEARVDLEAAIADLDEARKEERVELLIDLGNAAFFLLDTPALGRYTSEAVQMAEETGRADLAVLARSYTANFYSAEGHLEEALSIGRGVLATCEELGIEPPYKALGNYGMILYWRSRNEDSAALSAQAVEASKEGRDTYSVMWHYPQLGLALTALGRYAEAAATFDAAKQFGFEYQVLPLTARTISMQAGPYMDLFDLAGAEAVQEEARDLAASLNFEPPLISSGIDLLLNYARQQRPGEAARLIDPVGEAVARGAGWHGWLWRMRFAAAQAEIALAEERWEDAIEHARDALEQASGPPRPKYEAIAGITLGKALSRSRRQAEAIDALRKALASARRSGEPAIIVRAAGELLQVDGSDELAAESRALVEQINASVPDGSLRDGFLAAPFIEAIGRS